MKRLPVIAVILLALTACTGSVTPTPSSSSSEPPTTSIDARGLPLFAGEDAALRIGFESAEGSARVLLSVYSPQDRAKPALERARPSGLRLNICPLATLDARIKLDETCARDIGNGVRESVTSTGMVGIALFTLTATEEVLADVAIEFGEAGRAVTLAIPLLRSPAGGADCSDNGCNPFIEVQPGRKGAFSATAKWAGPDATLGLLQGSVIGRSQTATGLPYRQAAIDTGKPPASITANVGAPAEYALTFSFASTAPGQQAIRSIQIDAEWP